MTLDQLKEIVAAGDCILDNVPESVYHAFPAMSSTGLKEFKKGPGYWRFWRENPSKDTQARHEGRLVHMVLNEPARFRRDVVVIDGSRNATDVKNEIAAAKAAGKVVCKSEELLMAREIAAYCSAHPLVAMILKNGKGEQSMFWKCPDTGAQCKARIDWLAPNGVMIDFKTFDHVYSDDELERQIRKMGYHFQSAWYLWGYRVIFKRDAPAFYHGFIRHEKPYDVAVRKVSPHSISETEPYIHAQLAHFAICSQKNDWPMTPPIVGEIELKPFWN